MTHLVESALRRERGILIAGLVIISLLAWIYVINLSFRMTGAATEGGSAMEMPAAPMTMPNTQAWQGEDVIFTLVMWAVMMVAMMIPSAAPMILTFAALNRQRRAQETPVAGTAAFLLGYLIVWITFSAAATFIQWGFHFAGLLSPRSMSVTPLAGGILLMLAGAYQFTPLKNVCLSNCRTPVRFLLTEWRDGTRGALVMGLRHGLYCLGCCWPLMLLLFVAGVMNLLWVALIAGYVLIEKAIPAGQLVSRVIGLLSIGWGAWLFIQMLAP